MTQRESEWDASISARGDSLVKRVIVLAGGSTGDMWLDRFCAVPVARCSIQNPHLAGHDLDGRSLFTPTIFPFSGL